jgi:hypothetical protein
MGTRISRSTLLTILALAIIAPRHAVAQAQSNASEGGLSRPLRCDLQACRKRRLRVRYRSTKTSVNVCGLRQRRRGLRHGHPGPRAPAIDRMGAANVHVAHAVGKRR